jgi:hypothetical protein
VKCRDVCADASKGVETCRAAIPVTWSIVIILQITIAVSVVAPVFLVLVATVKVSSNSSGILRCGATVAVAVVAR